MQRRALTALLLLGLLSCSCGQSSSTTASSSTSATGTTGSSTMYSTSTSTSSAGTTSSATQPTSTLAKVMTTAAPTPIVDQCSCTEKNIWLDIYFLIDTSSAMTSPGFDGATSFVESVLYKMNIGQTDGQVSRVGFITYGSDAALQYPLTFWTSTDDMINNMNLVYVGSEGTNIEAAIKMASDNFAEPAHRPNVQKVIVIVASAYENGKYNDPNVAADTFKEDGGIIMTIEYVQEHGEPVPMLGKLATTGPYQFTNRYGNLTAEDVRMAFCRANCYCPTNYNPYNWNDVVPHGGCYRTVPISAVQVLAAKNCRQHHDAFLAKVENRDKSLFLGTLFPSKTKFWIGLTNVNGVYQWADGSILQTSDYQMWAPGYPNLATGACVYMYQYSGFSFGWFNDDCGDDWNYICQSTPCNTDTYCATLE